MMARFFDNEGTREIVPQQGSAFCYDELQALLAGSLEAIPLTERRILLVNADGQRKQLAPNPQATALVRHFLRPGESIVGPALVATLPELDHGRIFTQRTRQSHVSGVGSGVFDESDKQGCQELADLRRYLEPIEQHIAALEMRQRNPHLSEFGQYFPPGRRRGIPALSQRRAMMPDYTVRQLELLYRKRAEIYGQIEARTSGEPKQRREANAHHAAKRASALARLRAVHPNEYVIDSFYGIVKVVRVQPKTLTIETSSGYQERWRIDALQDVYRPQHWE